MTDAPDPQEEISRLEAQIETFAETIERCRKVALASRFAIVGGGLLLAAMILGIVRAEPALLIASFSAVIGGIVLYGSNSSTAQQATTKMQHAEALRAQLIGELDLEVVSEPTIH